MAGRLDLTKKPALWLGDHSRQGLPERVLRLLLVAWVTMGLAACGDPRRPHVVMILIDTLRADKLGCYGFELETSPEIDAIAAAGVRFERVVAQASWTRPSIGSLLTSRYPRSLGLYREQYDILDERFITLAEALRSGGYRTLGITANPNINSTFNFHQGFDRHVDSIVRFSWMDVEAHKPTVGEAEVTPAREIFRQVLELTGASTEGSPAPGGESPGGKPWYVQINVMDVHEHPRGDQLVREELQGLFPGAKDRAYLQLVRQVSADVGDFIRRWRSVPGRDDTLFILLSDHGEGLEDHPRVADSSKHGALLYESNLRVPWVIYHPSSDLEPRTVPMDVRLLDVMPTVLDYLGLPLPAGSQGASLMPWVEGAEQDLPIPEYFVVETYLRDHEKIAVRGTQWKYIENRRPHRGTGRTELQRVGRLEDGKWSTRVRGRREITRPMREFLSEWERRFPKQPPTAQATVPPEVKKQLEALGYLE